MLVYSVVVPLEAYILLTMKIKKVVLVKSEMKYGFITKLLLHYYLYAGHITAYMNNSSTVDSFITQPDRKVIFKY